MFSNCSAGGMAIAPGNDICKIPPFGIPMPFPNLASNAEAIPNVATIICAGGPVHNLNTVVPSTRGDEAGSMGGVASGTIAGLSRHVKGSSKVLIQGAPETRLTDITLPNNQNTAGFSAVPSQTITMTLS